MPEKAPSGLPLVRARAASGGGVTWLRLAAGLLLALVLLRVAHADPPDGVLEIAEAVATITVAGNSTTLPVALPYQWDREHPGQRGLATFRIRFAIRSLPDSPMDLYIPRLGNAYEIRLNGTLVERKGRLDAFNASDHAQLPRQLAVAPDLFRLENLLEVRIRADMGRRGGLSRIHLGPRPLVEPMYDRDYFWRVTGSVGVTVFSLVVGLGAIALWATQVDTTRPGPPRRDPIYLHAGLAELFWTLRVSDVLIENPPLPWPWWGMVPVVALGAWGCGMAMFCMEVAGWRETRLAAAFRRWLAALVVSSAVSAVMALALGWPFALTAWYAAMGCTFLAFGAIFLAHVLRTRSPSAHRIVALAILLSVAVGLRDLYVFRIAPAYGANSMIRYSALLFGVGLAYIVLVRFREATAQARELLQTLATRIADRETRLAHSYAEMEYMARERALAEERSRILRDMHDGVGAHLSTAIRQLESGLAQPGELLQTMRDSMDQLKLSVDALSLPHGDIGALLASLRYRLEPRLRSAGIELQWAVEPLPILPEIDGHRMRQLQFVLYEALSNVLQHAGADTVRIEAESVDGGIRLRIIDNGRGFPADVVPRNGLRSMRERCAAIGAQLEHRSEFGRTELEIQIGRGRA